MGIFEAQLGEEDFIETVKKWSFKFGKTIDQGVEINNAVLIECFIHARKSCKTHNQEKISNFKEAGHICYWIKKLKPIRIVVKKNSWDLFKEKVHQLLPNTPDIKKSINKEEEKYNFPSGNIVEGLHINEFVALFTALDLIQVGQMKIHDDLIAEGNEEEAKVTLDNMEKNYSKTKDNAEFLMYSLRYHSYTSLTMATKFEWTFS